MGRVFVSLLLLFSIFPTAAAGIRFRGKNEPGPRRTFLTAARESQLAQVKSALDLQTASSPAFGKLGFKERDSIKVGGIPTDIATADFNRDGHADFVVACGWDNTLWLHLGHGDGTFDAHIIQVGESPVAVSALDLRRNGIFDLVVLEIDDRTVSVLRGRGDGTFENPVSRPMPLPASPISMIDGDFNGDGAVDLVIGFITRGGERVPFALLPGDGKGNFGGFVWEVLAPTVPMVGPYYDGGPSVIRAADFDSDGTQDLVANSISIDGILGGVYVYLNPGNGRFYQAGNSLRYGAVVSVAVSDLDGDGDKDIQTSDYYSVARHHINSGTGEFVLREDDLGLGTIPWITDFRDMTGDGRPDIVAGGSNLSVLPAIGSSFGRPYVYRGETDMAGLACADFNEDGRLDVVTANQASDTATLFLNKGGGDFGDPQGRQIGLNPPNGASGGPGTGLLFGDVDGNGALDIVSVSHLTEGGPRYIVTALNDGTGRFLDPVLSQAMNQPILGDIVLGDFRNTGKLDFLAVGQSSPFICFAPNTGAGHFGLRSFSNLDNPRATGVVATGDFNRDGKLDLVTGGEGITLFRGNGDGTFTEAVNIRLPFSPNSWPVFMRSADFNKDGNLDLLVRLFGSTVPRTANGVYLLIGDGLGSFATPRVVLPNTGPIQVADVNHDGLLDILEIADRMDNYPEPTPARLTVYLGGSAGTFTKAGEYRPFSGWADVPYISSAHGAVPSYTPLTGDFNGDGHIDVALYQYSGAGSTYVTYYQVMAGNGDGTFTACYRRIEDRGGLPLPQFAADLTGDGRDDFVVVDEAISNFQVLPAVSIPSFQLEVLSPLLGETGVARISLNHPAEQTAVVNLWANPSEIHVPPSVSVPSGARTIEFEFVIDSFFGWKRPFSISADLDGERQTTVAYQWPKRPLYFPQIADGVSGNIRFHTDIILANVANDGSAEVEFYDSEARPLVVTIRGRGTGSVFRVPIGRGEEVKLQTSGEGQLKVGYARVVADWGIDGTVVYVRSELSGLTLYEAGVGASEPLLTATMLVDLRQPRSSAIAMVNVSGSGSRDATDPKSNSVRLRLYNDAFQLLGIRDLVLKPGEHRALFVTELFSDLDSTKLLNLQGSLTIEASQPLAATTLLHTDDPAIDFPDDVPNLTTYPVAPRSVDTVVTSEDPPRPWGFLAGKDRIMPQLANGCSGEICFRTQLSFMNPGPDTWTRIELFDPAGQPAEVELSGLGRNSVFLFDMKSGETRTFETVGTGPVQVAFAWLRIGDRVEALAIFTRFDKQTGRVFYRAGVPATAPRQTLSIPVDSLGNADTGIAIANKIVSSVWTANLQLRLYDSTFRLLAEAQHRVGPNQQLARFVGELFPDYPEAREMEGILTIHSDFPVAAVTLRQHENSSLGFPAFVPLLTTFPVLKGCPE